MSQELSISDRMNDMFVLGCMHALKALESVKDEGGDMNDIQWDVLQENQRRNLMNPESEKLLAKVDVEDLR